MRNRRGSNAIEFALTIPFMVLSLGGIFDWGLYSAAQSHAAQAANAGCRVGSFLDEDDGPGAAEARAKEVLNDFNLGASATVTASIVELNDEDALQLDVSIDYVSAILGSVMPTRIEVTRIVRLEGQD